ncbi:hypothetical protein AVEN_158204-1 [Araneus ventricosus]|uniref:Uncharacterized protein n=1 Tax=Araneus ventricosus TaxID=182803 RepID=A0A4Y2WL26_ARAVE|nr:hypothetical protein AVEN_158204-1 [Araneus ventricosus]
MGNQRPMGHYYPHRREARACLAGWASYPATPWETVSIRPRHVTIHPQFPSDHHKDSIVPFPQDAMDQGNEIQTNVETMSHSYRMCNGLGKEIQRMLDNSSMSLFLPQDVQWIRNEMQQIVTPLSLLQDVQWIRRNEFNRNVKYVPLFSYVRMQWIRK